MWHEYVQYVQGAATTGVLYIKDVLKILLISQENNCWSLFFIKKRLPTEMCSCEISNILWTPILKIIYLQMIADQMIVCNKILLEKIRAVFCI